MAGQRLTEARLLLCLCLGLGLPAALGIENPIRLPTGRWGLSALDNSLKNSGVGEAGNQDGLGPMGSIGYQPIAPHKGLHLAAAASTIRITNASAAMALQVVAEQQAQQGPRLKPVASQVAFSGQDLFTQTLGQQLTYHGGKTMTSPHNLTVYLIFYGSWSKRQRSIIRNFVASLDMKTSGGPKAYPTVAGWWYINYKYYYGGQKRVPITPSVRFGGILNDKGSMYPAGTKKVPLTHRQLQAIVNRAVDPSRRNHLPIDENGAYAVLTDKDTHTSDFCNGLCAFHTSSTFFGKKLAWTFIGNPQTQCPLYCTYRYFDPMYVPPNGDLGADAAADKLGHELAEIATNTLHGPGDRAGWAVGDTNVENADLCEWEYGNVNFERDMTVWNVKGYKDMRFLLQMNFDRTRSKCVLQWNSP